jgi:dipeptidase E
MYLLLTSNGITSKKIEKSFLKLLNKKPQNSKIFIIHSISLKEDFIFLDFATKELTNLGISKKNITYFNLTKEKLNSNLSNFDVFYVCGGNTFFILNQMKKSKVFKELLKLFPTKKIYLGVSAGSIIAGPEIKIAGWGSEADENQIKLKNFKSLNFTNLSIFPHYKNKLKKEVQEFQKKVKYKVIPLKDKEALVIQGKSIKFLKNK